MEKEKGRIIVPFEILESNIKAFKDVDLPDHVDRKAMKIKPNLEVFEFKGYASTFGNEDRGSDIVVSGAFAEFIDELMKSSDMLPALWQHRSDAPVGTYLELKEDAKGLFVHGIMPKSDTFVSGRVIPQMEVGSVRKMSIGYFIKDFSWDGDVRLLKKLGLWEISLVTIPMNNEADITELKKWGESIGLNDIEIMTERDLEKALHSGLPLSKEASKVIVGLLKRREVALDSDDAGRDALKTLSTFAQSQDQSARSITESLKRLEKNDA